MGGTAEVDARGEHAADFDGGGLHYADKYDYFLLKVKFRTGTSPTTMAVILLGPELTALTETIFHPLLIRSLT